MIYNLQSCVSPGLLVHRTFDFGRLKLTLPNQLEIDFFLEAAGYSAAWNQQFLEIADFYRSSHLYELSIAGWQ